ncbi:hypothetical protein [Carbonactinospora thermoautotrophica]|nr:hypothetical protein [Carbonactinospora thermoautotrophica]
MSDNTAKQLRAALQRTQPTEPPVLIRLVQDSTPLPVLIQARIPGQRRGEAR